MRILFMTTLCLAVAFSTVAKPILIVTTDIGQDPDDQQSIVRLLHHADKFHLAGIIANADANYEEKEPAALKDDLLHQMVDAYGEIEYNLRVHSPDFPSAAYLHSIIKKGCYGNGRDVPVERYIGEGKDTEGSDWIIEVVDNASDVVHIAVWGGACDIAQALWKVRATRTPAEQSAFVRKLRVYFIGLQDSSNEWVMESFPDLWLVFALAPSGNKWESSYRGMFLGGDMQTTSRPWLQKHIIGVNPLGAMYPDEAYTGGADRNPHGAMKEGDSPSMLFFLENGLNVPSKPQWGGWGGRFVKNEKGIFRDAADILEEGEEASLMATVFRWRDDFQAEFACRAAWGATADYAKANHHPRIVLSGFMGDGYTRVDAQAGKEIAFDASLSFDPDKDKLDFEWWFYPEAGTYKDARSILLQGSSTSNASFVVPSDASGKQLHLLLRVSDRHALPLVSYKRIVIDVR